MKRISHTWPVAVALATACGSGTEPETTRVPVQLELVGLRALDPATEGSYEAWAVGSDGTVRSAGRFTPSGNGNVTVQSPIENPASFRVTIEPPGDTDDLPSGIDLFTGTVSNGAAELSVVRAITGVDDFETDPGHHALFTPSDNAELNFPSREDAGIWVFAPRPSETRHGNDRIWLTPLRPGWTYEGWIVYQYGTADECWISYGKFLPKGVGEEPRRVDVRDDTGLGIFSGQFDYVNALPVEVDIPGDDWVSNIHGQQVPCGLTLPFDLNGKLDTEPPDFVSIPSPWTHVITIEPSFDEGEPPLSERPFLIQPYRNPFGQGPPNEGREIVYQPDLVPSGTAMIGR